eukprot:TRINITY_DN11918_c0_g2_i5.p1 TRINITY_DN11918_c0_g2~~TRINITY_DN11918_c0_g2_i5.p1  ORF type:complete len:385 (+),score=45.35 TRINITY_DN11918_c0_g2_i5:161-1315(+)
MTFGSIKALQRYDDQQRAQELLERAAKQVLPIMAKRSWKVTLLVEFFPNNPNLLGLNVNRTQKICVRLRPHRNPRSFYPYEDILGTLLHELAHIVRGPHDTVFYKQLDELKDEAETLMVRQQFGIGPAALPQAATPSFSGKGSTLGGKLPLGRMAADPREAARRAALARNSGRKLGSASQGDWKGKTPREMAAAAALRRRRDAEWCANAQAGIVSTQDGCDKDKAGDTVANQWQCGSCTLINTKPHAPVCELCGSLRPNISASSHEKTKTSSADPQRDATRHSGADQALNRPAAHVSQRAGPMHAGSESSGMTQPQSSTITSNSSSRTSDSHGSLSQAAIGGGQCPPIAMATDAARHWACDRCTFSNHPELRYCEICTQPRSKR